MSQNKQYQKTKKMRGWKIACYMLSFPLFIFAVFCSAIKFMGQDPFTGGNALSSSLNMFELYETFITGPAFYGLWIALGIWLIVSIFHLIISKTVKSQRARMFAVVAFCLIIMFGGLFAMDAIFEAKITEIANNAPDGVVVENYKTQLSYYRTMTTAYKGTSYTAVLKDKVAMLEKVYNVDMLGANKTGTAGSTSNKPVTYYNIIDDEGNTGVDISFTADEKGILRLNLETTGSAYSSEKGLLGYTAYASSEDNILTGDGAVTKDIEGNNIVKLYPNKKGQLVINSKVYSHYFYQKSVSLSGAPTYVWYCTDLTPASFEYTVTNEQDGKGASSKTDGIYGEAIYARNGALADGWIYSLENVIEILEDYYESSAEIAKYTDKYASIYSNALMLKEQYYTGAIEGPDGELCDPFIQALYAQEVDMNAKFSLTRGELDAVLAAVGGLLGKNELFGYLFKGGLIGLIGGFSKDTAEDVDTVIGNLPNGIGLKDLLTGFKLDGEGIVATIANVVDMIKPDYREATGITEFATGTTYYTYAKKTETYTEVPAGTAFDSSTTYYTKKAINDVYVVAAYDSDIPFEYKFTGEKHVDHLYIALVKDDGAGNISTDPKDLILDIDFADYYKEFPNTLNEDGSINYEYAFDLDNLSTFLNNTLNNLIASSGFDISSLSTILELILKTDDGGVYLEVSGLKIYLMDKDYKKFILDINGILMDLLSGLYAYQSPTIKPVWEFFEDWTVDESMADPDTVAAQKWYTIYYRALFAGDTQGALINSQLISAAGDGTYDISLGLADLTSVQQLKTDLSYMPVYYPLFALRDCLMLFSGIVVLFYFLSFCASAKEAEYAAGEIAIKEKEKKAKKSKKSKDAEENADGEATEEGAVADQVPEGEKIGDDWSLDDGEKKDEKAEESNEADADDADDKKGKKAKKDKKEKKEKKGKKGEEAEEEKEDAPAEEKADVPAEEKSNEEVAE